MSDQTSWHRRRVERSSPGEESLTLTRGRLSHADRDGKGNGAMIGVVSKDVARVRPNDARLQRRLFMYVRTRKTWSFDDRGRQRKVVEMPAISESTSNVEAMIQPQRNSGRAKAKGFKIVGGYAAANNNRTEALLLLDGFADAVVVVDGVG